MAGRQAGVLERGVRAVKQVKGPVVRLQPHKRHCEDVESLYQLCWGLDKPLAIDLFCGAGGLSLGLRDAGFEVVLGVDCDRDAIETHAAMFPGLSCVWDLAKRDVVERVVEIVQKARISLVAGGPPCQPFSTAGRALMKHLVATGRREAKDKRREMWQVFLRIVERSLPPAVLLENVPELALEPDMGILRAMVGRLEKAGYTVHGRLIETWRYGVPQFRERFFMVAVRKGLDFAWPAEVGNRTTVANAIDDLPPVEGGDRPEGGAEGWWPYDAPKSWFQKRARRRVSRQKKGRVYDHITRPVRSDDLEVFKLMDETTRYDEIPDELKRYRDDIFTDKYKRLNGNDLSRTITAHIAKDGYWYIHPSEHRTLTVREAARIQTFCDDVRFAGAPSVAFRQIGNAVPPLMAEHLGVAIVKSLAGAGTESSQFLTCVQARNVGRWFRRLERRASPWLAEANRWQTILCEMLFDRVRADLARQAWPLVTAFSTPAAAIDGERDLFELGGFLGRRSAAERIVEAAKRFSQQPELLGSHGGVSGVKEVPNAVAALASWVEPVADVAPIVATAGLIRVANRVDGRAGAKSNIQSDGRIAIARLVGDKTSAKDAYLGLVELSRTVCRSRAPLCGECPLAEVCKTRADGSGYDATLF